MLNFGFKAGSSGPLNCDARGTQLFDNSSFNCGVENWTSDPTYPATITDNGDGSIHLQSDTEYGSIIPTRDTHPDESYDITIAVRNVTGAGKVSIRDGGGTWHSQTLVDGTNTYPYVGVVDTVNIGADNDVTFECDFDFVGMSVSTVPRSIDDFAVQPGDTVMGMTWTAPDNEGASPVIDYGLYMTPGGTGTELVFAGWTENLTEQFTGLVNGTTYDFGVTARNAQGEGPMSNVETGTPEAAGTDIVDMDQDGNRDVIIGSDGTVTVSVDVDSTNIDLDGDMIADIVLDR